eukprot:CAMPEP_0115571210 /NCGR_PEP_ID=MMETSP0271-20121206/106093_1 /TAXON_ID=71861 /ORGANISM="Scrippsiella trochoidea, Strain CCMP3099" /LENGTH=216 /DNA_ID=CAMNT_0003005763 /DNA_START=40 /DNA_END=686 /DNA_ORIENTATION=-
MEVGDVLLLQEMVQDDNPQQPPLFDLHQWQPQQDSKAWEALAAVATQFWSGRRGISFCATNASSRSVTTCPYTCAVMRPTAQQLAAVMGGAAARKASGDSCESEGRMWRLGSYCTLSAWSSVPTTSDATGVSSTISGHAAPGAVATAAAALASVLGAGIRKIASFTKGIELLRPPSERALLWAAAATAQGPGGRGTPGSADFSHLIKVGSADFGQF